MRKKLLTTITAAALTAALSISAWAAPYIPITEDMHDDYGVCLLGENVKLDGLTEQRGDVYVYCYSKDLAVRVNGYLTDFPDAQPFIDENDRTLIPLRFVTEALGADVSWDQATKTATVEQDGIRCDITIGKADMLVTENGNTTTVTMDTQAVLKDSRTFVPIRYVAESLGAWVGWSNAYKTVEIVKGHLTPEEDRELYNTHIPTFHEVKGWSMTYESIKAAPYHPITKETYHMEPWNVICEAAGGTPENAVEYYHRNEAGASYRLNEYTKERKDHQDTTLIGTLTKRAYRTCVDDTGLLVDILIEESEKRFNSLDIPGIKQNFRTDAANIMAYEQNLVELNDAGGEYMARGVLDVTPISQEGVDFILQHTALSADDVEIGHTYKIASAIYGIASGVVANAYTNLQIIGLTAKS